ncbi:unconventional myosin-XVI-like [Lampetra fluviatilis]
MLATYSTAGDGRFKSSRRCVKLTPLPPGAREGVHRCSSGACPVLTPGGGWGAGGLPHAEVSDSDTIEELLLEAEAESGERQRYRPLAVAGADTAGRAPDVATDDSALLRKLKPLLLPISKQDSFAEKDAMFKGSALFKQASLDDSSGGHSRIFNKYEQVKLMPPAPSDDLATLSELTESSLLYEIQKRYSNNQIYTYIGDTLLVVNPCKELPIYSNMATQLYSSHCGRFCPSLPPHVFACAERAFHTMLRERRSQCFILGGESGSGKSEASKHIAQHLLRRGPGDGPELQARLLHVSCLLESFGNAVTPVNAESSRFSQHLEIHFDARSGRPVGARVFAYCLEKSRLVAAPAHQGNFKIFRLMSGGLTADERSYLYLSNMASFRYLKESTWDSTPTASTSDKERLDAVKTALQALSFSNNTCMVSHVLPASLREAAKGMRLWGTARAERHPGPVSTADDFRGQRGIFTLR